MAEENNNPTPNTEENIESNPTPTSGGSNNKNGGLIATIIILSILLVVAIFLALFFGLRNNSGDEEQVNPDPEIVEPGPVEDPDDDGDGDEPDEGEPTHVHSTTGSGYLIAEQEVDGVKLGLVEFTCDECGLLYTETKELHFATDDWETINSYSEAGTAKYRYFAGETKEINMTGVYYEGDKPDSDEPVEQPLTLRIIGIDHDDLSDGSGKAGITIETVNLMHNLGSHYYSMMESGSSSNDYTGWETSYLRSRMLPYDETTNNGDNAGDIYSMLPSDLSPYIKTVDKVTTSWWNTGGNNKKESVEFVTTADKLFTLSPIEVASDKGLDAMFEYYGFVESETGGVSMSPYHDEGSQYEFFKHTVGDTNIGIFPGEPTLKYMHFTEEDDDIIYDFDEPAAWLLRSPCHRRQSEVWGFGYMGQIGIMEYNDSIDGLDFAFCI